MSCTRGIDDKSADPLVSILKNDVNVPRGLVVRKGRHGQVGTCRAYMALDVVLGDILCN